MERKKYIFLIIIFNFSLLILILANIISSQNKINSLKGEIDSGSVSFIELPSGFYDSDITVNINVPEQYAKELEIYYTTDGNEPTLDSEKFLTPIVIRALEKEQIVTFKTKVYWRKAEIFQETRTYFVGKNIYARYKTRVINIVIDDENLFDTKKGIFVKGERFENFVNQGGDPDSAEAFLLCNFKQKGKNWLKNAEFYLFDIKGNELIASDVLIGIDGNGSTVNPVKTLKLYLDKNTFPYEKAFGSETQYDKILLKSGGQEYELTTIRWDVISDLANQIGFSPLASHEQVVVYINGKYYAMMSLSPEYTKENLKNMCGLQNCDIQKTLAGNYNVFTPVLNIEEFKKMDMLQKKQQLNQLVDLENLFQYYALEFLTNNIDWPNANYKIWRVGGGGKPDFKNKYSDGKWRFLLFDMDFTYLAHDNWRADIFGSESIQKTFEESSFDVFTECMHDNLYQKEFVNYICWLMGTTFRTDNVLQTIDKYNRVMEYEFQYYEESKYNKGEWLEIYKKNRSFYVDEMKNAARNRNMEVFQCLSKYLNLSSGYCLEIDISPIDYYICHNTMAIKKNGSKYITNHFGDFPVEIGSLDKENKGKISFLINDKLILHSDKIIIDSSWIENSKINVKILIDE